MQTSLTRHTRCVDQCGETLIVRDLHGFKVLTDPCDNGITVVVPVGRRAKLVRFAFSGLVSRHGRDAYVVIFQSDAGLGFASVECPEVRVCLQDLCEGQLVDVLPSAEPASAYAVVVRPLPVLFGAATVQPVYAASAA